MEVEARAKMGSDFGTLLRRHRIAAGLSQEALAELARMSSDGISALERGHRRTPQRETVTLLAGALALNPEQRYEFEAAAAPPSATRRGARVTVGPWSDTGSATLPLSLSSFVGRDNELEEITVLLREHRLVTLTGAGGVGKTQAALRVVAALDAVDDGIRFIPLAPLDDPGHVVPAVALALGLQEVPNRPLLETIVAYLKNNALLLLFDNCEHVIAECAAVIERILSACPQVRILATSREPLKAAGEYAYRLPSLSIEPSASLFADRAQAVDHHFKLAEENQPAVARLCQQLDGIPLAIELAAARVNVLSVESLTEELGQRFRILGGGGRTAPPRQQTMRATIDWSYDLLTAPERQVFERLSVFAGGCTIAAATAVCVSEGIAEDDVLELLALLVDKSLVVVDFGPAGARYRLLEPFRQYAAEKLASRAWRDEVAHRHARASLEQAERASRAYESDRETVAHAIWRAELDNWRAALRWTLTDRHDVVLGQRIVGASSLLWSSFRHERHWFDAALENADAQTPIDVLAKLEIARLRVANVDGDVEIAFACSIIELCERAGDAYGKTLAQVHFGNSLVDAGRIAEGRHVLQDALAAADSLGYERCVTLSLRQLGYASALEGDFTSARSYITDALQRALSVGHDARAAWCIQLRAIVEQFAGDAATSLRYATDALVAFRGLDLIQAHAISTTLAEVSACLIDLGRYDEAERSAREALTFAQDFQMTGSVRRALRHIATIAAFQKGEPGQRQTHMNAARIIGFIEAQLATGSWAWFESPERRHYDRAQALLRDELGSDAFAKHMSDGATLTEDEAVAESFCM